MGLMQHALHSQPGHCFLLQVEGITLEILAEALKQARAARQHILGKMEQCRLAHPPLCTLLAI